MYNFVQRANVKTNRRKPSSLKNSILDTTLFGRRISKFLLIAIVGVVLSFVFSVYLVLLLQLSFWPLLVAYLIGAFAFYMSSIVKKSFTGKESYVMYQQLLIILFSIWLFVSTAIPDSAAEYMDICSLSYGIIIGVGRLGCNHVGCCHGRPCGAVGKKYSILHADDGFPRHYVGIRLFPTQIFESIFLLILITPLTVSMHIHYAPGMVIYIFLMVYATYRFFIEFVRGDTDRPFGLGLSEAQWTSVIIVWCIYFWTNTHLSLIISTLLIVASTIVIILYQTNREVRQAYLPNSIADLGDALDRLDWHGTKKVKLVKMKNGIRISKGKDGKIINYTMSKAEATTPKRLMKIYARQIKVLNKHTSKGRIQMGQTSDKVFHILFEDDTKERLSS